MNYKTYNQLMKERYGCKVYKLALSAGCTCPNRDGTKGVGGCTFCGGGSGAFAQSGEEPVEVQIDRAKSLVRQKGAQVYVAYFQSYTSTYGAPEVLLKKFLAAARHPDIVELSIATRPDCLGPEILAVLKQVQAVCPVTVELGLQTIHPATARRINRCYPLSVYDLALGRLHEMGIPVVTHLILGLPGETPEDMEASAAYVGAAAVPGDGVKLQLLHILEGTELARVYRDNPFPLLTLPEYAQVVGRCLQALPEWVIVHRITGDGAKKDLIAPLWSGDKKRVLNYLNRYLAQLPEERVL